MFIKLETVKKLIDKKTNVKTKMIEGDCDGFRVYKFIDKETQKNYCTLFADIEIIKKDGRQFLSLQGILNGVLDIDNQPITLEDVRYLINNND